MNGLKEITARYFTMLTIELINCKAHLGEWENLNVDMQHDLLVATVLHPRSQRYPPSLQYRIRFIKFFITKLENAGVEVCDLMYETLGDLMGQPIHSDGDYCYKTYTLPGGKMLSIKESQHIISKGTTGLRTWQAAQFLAEWVMENSHVFKDKRVLELGSGLGLTGLVIHATCQPADLILTDCHADVLKLLTRNIDANVTGSPDGVESGVDTAAYDMVCDRTWRKSIEVCQFATRWQHRHEANLQVAALDWERLTGDDVVRLLGKVDVVVAADVVYDPSIIPALVRTFNALLRQQPAPLVYIASTIRHEATRDEFLCELDNYSISHIEIVGPSESVFFYDISTPIQLLQLQVLHSGTKIATF